MDDFKGIFKQGLFSSDLLKEMNSINPNLNYDLYKPIKIDRVSPDEIREYQNKSIELLQQITVNTASISDLVNLVSQSNDKQDELIEVMTQILEIAKAKTKEDAGNKFTQIMKKISSSVENAETVQKLSYFAMLTYNTVISFIDKIG